MRANVARIWHVPEQTAGRVTIGEHWIADNFFESCAVDSREDAIAYCQARWGSEVNIIETGRDGEKPYLMVKIKMRGKDE